MNGMKEYYTTLAGALCACIATTRGTQAYTLVYYNPLSGKFDWVYNALPKEIRHATVFYELRGGAIVIPTEYMVEPINSTLLTFFDYRFEDAPHAKGVYTGFFEPHDQNQTGSLDEFWYLVEQPDGREFQTPEPPPLLKLDGGYHVLRRSPSSSLGS